MSGGAQRGYLNRHHMEGGLCTSILCHVVLRTNMALHSRIMGTCPSWWDVGGLLTPVTPVWARHGPFQSPPDLVILCSVDSAVSPPQVFPVDVLLIFPNTSLARCSSVPQPRPLGRYVRQLSTLHGWLSKERSKLTNAVKGYRFEPIYLYLYVYWFIYIYIYIFFFNIYIYIYIYIFYYIKL